MIKYTRSIQTLSARIANVLADTTVSLDTRAIVLMLAATLPCVQFGRFIDPLHQLDHLNAAYKEINSLRFEYGHTFRDYIILSVLTNLQHDVKSDELQRFILCSLPDEAVAQLEPALNLDQMCKSVLSMQVQPNTEFLQARDSIVNFITQDNAEQSELSLQILRDAYLKCREQVSAMDAYYALLAALQEILQVGGLDVELATQRARLLAEQAMQEFIAQPVPPSILPTFAWQKLTRIRD